MSKSATIIDPIMPGEILASEFLEPMNISARKLAGHIGVPANRITEIIKGRRSITGDTALRLSKAFGTTPEFWINLQSHYELERARDAAGDLSISPLHAA
ncbi:HigA family addiction module antidote protein [Sinorhizobium meliloti WSM1022]|jgi:antitoxin HigA-1|nr:MULTISPECIES: HigA family addiction module antitoxin [Sinorhizobium]PII38297.1 XRE family plasmid maintenance system antidote protein [Sinorhizobium meliloti CCBAU 01290]TWA96857.1 addiction module HigA family antidote [Ensifer sp. SEMIA 134]TWB32881.1 addiction module HigA family antidote [Ensifer sp. SEMIA 135]AEG05782.1 plasmid maintenance system antidote protein, XRE family [Sinorhizobium meliloti BL225C]AEG54818.1 plasmid maintenance system antidote protein, XRE family [Sinorhizobium m